MNKFAIFVILLFLSFGVFGQKKYEKKETVEGVGFYTKWAKSNFFKKDSAPQLRIMVKNTNDFPVNYTFAMDLFLNGKHSQSIIPETFKIGAKRTKQGKVNGHYYDVGMTWDEIRSESFSLEFSDIVIEKSSVETE
ncbi:MAG: hypothetical protein SGI87_06040 [Flavobacteriales bacterium]|nr:hypothetical protein [Flavobacteriales bacterium]